MEKIMDLCNEQNCCGCGMCEKKCPKQAIEIKENENGKKKEK